MEEKRLEHPEERQDEKQEKKKQYPVTRRDLRFSYRGCRQERSSAGKRKT